MHCFTPRERVAGTHWLEGWGGPQSWSGHSGEEKKLPTLPGLEPPIIQAVAQCYTISTYMITVQFMGTILITF
jgi:hypothetical protein